MRVWMGSEEASGKLSHMKDSDERVDCGQRKAT